MSLESLLAFAGILVAIYALADPVQRWSIRMFVRRREVILVYVLAFTCVVAPQVSENVFGVPWAERYRFLTSLAAFCAPVLCLAYWLHSWRSALLAPDGLEEVSGLIQTAIRENRFDEAERVLRANASVLHQLRGDSQLLLFDSALVDRFFRARSFLHLELLADMVFLRSLDQSRVAVGSVVRQLLKADVSPLRAAVRNYDSKYETYPVSDSDRLLMERTFLNPRWYLEAGPCQALCHATVEALQSGRFDAEYNESGRNYETGYGVSTHSTCPVFIAVKAQVMVIERAIEAGTDGDFYVTNLCQLFRFIAQRSEYRADVWESPLNHWEHPTPYSYLLYEIQRDMWNLSAEAIKKGTPGQPICCPEIASQIATSWASCVNSAVEYGTAESPRIGRRFMLNVVTSFFKSILLLEFEHHGFFMREDVPKSQVEPWVKLYVDAFKRCGIGFREPEKGALRTAYNALDMASYRVRKGKDWLGKEFGLA